MESLQHLESFLGWCTVLHVALLMLCALCVVCFRKPIAAIHGKMFGMDEASLTPAYFKFLAQYEIGIFLFSFVPYLALRVGF